MKLNAVRLRAARRRLKITQLEMARRLGKTQATISKYETGHIVAPADIEDVMKQYGL